MIKPASFFWKCCSIAVICLYHIDGAFGMVIDHDFLGDTNRPITTRIAKKTEICDKNYYLTKCSGYNIGINTLHGGKFYDKEKSEEQGQQKNIEFPDLLKDVTNVTDADLVNAFRYYFHSAGDTNPITETNDIIEKIKDNKENSEQPVNGAKEFLEFLCNPLKWQTTCLRCPGDGITNQRSYIELNGDTITKWHVNTIADCYMKEFHDLSGTFVYTEDTASNASSCLYNVKYVPDGDNLPQKVLYYQA